MIESLVYMLLAIGNSFFDAFVFMFGWNTIIHKIGLPEISFGLSYGLCMFIAYLKPADNDNYDGEDRKKRIRTKIIYGIVNNLVYIVIFLVFKWIVG